MYCITYRVMLKLLSIKCRKPPRPAKVWVVFIQKRRCCPCLLCCLLFYANAAKMSRLSAVEILDVEGKLMGQAMEKLESFYVGNHRSARNGRKISINSIENSHIYNNLDNDDYDYKKVLITKSNAIKMYLDRNKIENIGEVENLTIRLVEKVENKYLSVEEAANYLDCTTKTIRNRIKAGMPYETDKNKYMISIENLEKWPLLLR